MWANSRVIDHYIDQEFSRLFDQDPDSVRASLSQCAKRFFRREISITDASRAFQAHPAGIPVLKQIQQILDLTDIPLPALSHAPPAGKTLRKCFPWTAAEDLRLLAAVARFGAKDWRRIAAFLGAGRSASQCNQRWCRALDPAIIRSQWDGDEDQKLLRAVELLGKTNWCQVAKIIPGRTDLQCRYRYLQLGRQKQVAQHAQDVPAKQSGLDENAKKRRNSISIAPFTHLNSFQKLLATPMLPYYLESSLEPRDAQIGEYLHRVPPLLLARGPPKS
jgi:hypothetical protein